MSGTIALAITALTDAERADVRRFAGFPMFGNSASGFMGPRFFQAFGTLEYRLTNAAPAELQVIRGYLAQLYVLETAITGAGENLDTASAAIWKRNPKEIQERTGLFNDWRRRLCGFLGVPPGPALGEGGIRVVV